MTAWAVFMSLFTLYQNVELNSRVFLSIIRKLGLKYLAMAHGSYLKVLCKITVSRAFRLLEVKSNILVDFPINKKRDAVLGDNLLTGEGPSTYAAYHAPQISSKNSFFSFFYCNEDSYLWTAGCLPVRSGSSALETRSQVLQPQLSRTVQEGSTGFYIRGLSAQKLF